MRKSFYTWLMAQRNPKSNEPVAILADLAFEDSTFPKQQPVPRHLFPPTGEGAFFRLYRSASRE